MDEVRDRFTLIAEVNNLDFMYQRFALAGVKSVTKLNHTHYGMKLISDTNLGTGRINHPRAGRFTRQNSLLSLRSVAYFIS